MSQMNQHDKHPLERLAIKHDRVMELLAGGESTTVIARELRVHTRYLKQYALKKRL
jgi:hypothetical protein